MISRVLPPATAQLAPPAVFQPAPYEVSFGRVEGRAARGTTTIRVFVGGRPVGEQALSGPRFALTVRLPSRDVTLRVVALDTHGRRASTLVGPVFALPAAAAPTGRAPPGFEDRSLARSVRALAGRFRGTSAVFVQDFRTGAGAAWNARAHLPAASTLKLAIAVELLRSLGRVPAPGSRLDVLARRMLVLSDGEAANELLVRIGGSTSGGSARVNAMLRTLAIADTDMYGGYLPDTRTPALHGRRRPIPLRLETEPSFVGKRTTAWDLARLARAVHLGAGGSGPLVRRFRGAFTPSDARYLLYLLAHVREPGRLSRFLGGSAAVLHKAGWITNARHDNGLVYWPGGAFVVTVLTWNGGGVGASSDVLAARVARTALDRLTQLAPGAGSSAAAPAPPSSARGPAPAPGLLRPRARERALRARRDPRPYAADRGGTG
jgi:beta-lactamase class A